MKNFEPREYQKAPIQAIAERKHVALFADVGSGKTVMTLAGLEGADGLTLIVAPLRAAMTVWPSEITKFTDKTYSLVTGAKAKREKAMEEVSDFYITNPENIPWLMETYYDEFTNLIVDESHKFKSPSSKRFRALRNRLVPFKRRVILTATPSTNSCLDLWSQMFIVDRGKSLEPTISKFRNKYAYRGGYMGRVWLPNHDADKKITQASRDSVFRVEVEIEGDTLFNDIEVTMSPKEFSVYKKAERQLIIELENGDEKITESAIAAYSLCKQISNGSFYDDEKNVHHVHSRKVEAAQELVESLQGKSVLIFYSFKHDRNALLDAFPDAEVLDGSTKADKTLGIVERFGNGDTQVLLAHPASAGTGIDGLQHNCSNICWFGLPDDLALYLQANGRIAGHRANGKTVTISRIISDNTVDRVISGRLQSKDATQTSILKSYRR